MIDVSYNLRDFSVAIDVLEQLRQRIEDPSDILEIIGENLVISTEQRFIDSEDPQGFSWENLAPLTRDRKLKKERGYADKPLLTSRADLATSIISQLQANSLVVGSTSQYAVFHQSTRPRNKIPRRAFLGVSEDDATMIRETLNAWLRSR